MQPRTTQFSQLPPSECWPKPLPPRSEAVVGKALPKPAAFWEIAPKQQDEENINAVRMILPRCWFDSVKCRKGVEALKLYTTDLMMC
jgi:hypothetical protein